MRDAGVLSFIPVPVIRDARTRHPSRTEVDEEPPFPVVEAAKDVVFDDAWPGNAC